MDGARLATGDTASMNEVTRLLRELDDGSPQAADALAPLVYDELHQMAVQFMRRERDDHTLQPTALVHDAWMRLVDQQHAGWQNRSHFFGIASHAMRRILVDHARRHRAAKRDGGHRITLDPSLVANAERSLDLIALDEALERLAALDERQARVVELRFFGGLNVEETARVLGISRATANRDWTFARTFLQREIERGELDRRDDVTGDGASAPPGSTRHMP